MENNKRVLTITITGTTLDEKTLNVTTMVKGQANIHMLRTGTEVLTNILIEKMKEELLETEAEDTGENKYTNLDDILK